MFGILAYSDIAYGKPGLTSNQTKTMEGHGVFAKEALDTYL